MNNAAFNKQRSENKIKRRKQQLQLRIGAVVVVLSVFILILVIRAVTGKGGDENQRTEMTNTEDDLYVADQPQLDVQLLTVNKYSRPGEELKKVESIVVHWTANPGTSAMQNRNYFEGLKDSHKHSASAHFIIGLEGEIVQCIPCNEISYANYPRNYETITIECCTPDEDGKFNESTYESLLHLVSWLMGRYKLTVDDVIRHYDVSGKDCPHYFVEHPDEWDKFKVDLQNYILLHGVKREQNKIENKE